MNERVANAASRLDAIAVPLCLERLHSLGEHESGAYNFYAERLRKQSIFGDYELALAAALLAWPDAPRKLHEVGCGFASLSLLLSSLGFEVTGLEFDPRRFAGASAMLDVLATEIPSLAVSCRILNARFPPADVVLPPQGAAAIVTNLVCTTGSMERARMISALASYPWAIIDIDRFLTPLTTIDEREARLADLSRGGLAGAPFLDLGGSACFYRFGDGHARPAPSLPAEPSARTIKSGWFSRLRRTLR